MRILVINKVDPVALEILERHFELDMRLDLDGQALVDNVAGYECILMRAEKLITRQVIEAADKLKIIAVGSIGLDHIDRQAAAERGIVYFGVPGGNSQSVAEATIGLILAVCRRFLEANGDLRTKYFNRAKYPAMELECKTLGLVGIGQIGMRVARLGMAFGMKILAYDPYVRIVYDPSNRNGETPSHKIELVALDELLSRSDVVSLHCPLTAETHRMISTRELALMRPHAFLINTARGPVLDEAALRNALIEKRIAGAAVDVFDEEPTRGVPFDSPLLEVDPSICLLTPHIAGVTRESQVRIGEILANRIMDEARRLGLWNG